MDKTKPIQERVVSIVEHQLDVTVEDISQSLVNDLGADSLDTVELVMAFEEHFDIEIRDAEVEHMFTVSDAINIVKNLVDSATEA